MREDFFSFLKVWKKPWQFGEVCCHRALQSNMYARVHIDTYIFIYKGSKCEDTALTGHFWWVGSHVGMCHQALWSRAFSKDCCCFLTTGTFYNISAYLEIQRSGKSVHILLRIHTSKMFCEELFLAANMPYLD